jgi:uncharacterized tellurite resistance protein B-like protein
MMAMLSLKKLLLKTPIPDSHTKEREEIERVQVATAVILLEVARSDEEFSSIEKTTVAAILKKKFGLSKEATAQLLEVAKKKRKESVDFWQFTNLINENYSGEQKKKIVEAAWRVIYADAKLDKYEDYLVHKLAMLLRLNHADLIEAKLKVKSELRAKPGISEP